MSRRKQDQAAQPAPAPAKKKPAAKKKQKRAPRAPDKKILAEKQKKNPVGRPSKLTPEITGTICNAIRAGNYIETAAALAGIDKVTIYQWMKDGAAGKSPEHIDFSNAIKKALAESEVGTIAGIRAAGKESWQALAWLAERRFRERWGKSLNVTNDLKDKSTEELLALLEEADS